MLRSFVGAFVTHAGMRALVVVVSPAIVIDDLEADLHVLAFAMRYRRPTLLVAFDARGAPTYYGPRELVDLVVRLPPSAVVYRRYAQTPEVAPIDRVCAFQRVAEL